MIMICKKRAKHRAVVSSSMYVIQCKDPAIIQYNHGNSKYAEYKDEYCHERIRGSNVDIVYKNQDDSLKNVRRSSCDDLHSPSGSITGCGNSIHENFAKGDASPLDTFGGKDNRRETKPAVHETYS